jgi:hypothetical protein
MKHISKLLLIAPIAFLLLFQNGVTSCTKDTLVKTDTVIKKDTIIQHDTIVKKDTMLTAQILTSHPWKVLEERGVHGGEIIYYLRGGSSNTQSFDNEYITFNSNNTGVLTINSGQQFNFTWTFANTDNTKLTWTVLNSPATYTITWDNIRLNNGNLNHDQYFTDGNTGQHSHTQQIRMPK